VRVSPHSTNLICKRERERERERAILSRLSKRQLRHRKLNVELTTPKQYGIVPGRPQRRGRRHENMQGGPEKVSRYQESSSNRTENPPAKIKFSSISTKNERKNILCSY